MGKTYREKFIDSHKDIIKEIIKIVTKLTPKKNENFKRHVKHTLQEYVEEILIIAHNHTSWNSYIGIINGNTLRKKNSEWVKLGVYDRLHEKSLDNYFKIFDKKKELEIQSIDSTFIRDKNGCKKAARNAVYKCNKGEAANGIKITSIVTKSGMPISVNIDSGNIYDSKLLPKAISNIVTKCKSKKEKVNNQSEQYLLADKGYDSKDNHTLLIKKRYTPIIAQNIRNIKNPKLIRKMTPKHKKIFKKRNIVENYHSWIKKFCKIYCLHEKNIKNYKGLLLLTVSMIISKRIANKIS